MKVFFAHVSSEWVMYHSCRGAYWFRGNQILVDFMAELKRKLFEEVARSSRVANMIVAKLKVWRLPSEEPRTPFSVWLLELTPTRKALLIAMSSACRKKGWMNFLLRFFTNRGAASKIGLLGMARASLQEIFWVSWIEGKWGRLWNWRGKLDDEAFWFGAIFDLDDFVKARSRRGHGRGGTQCLSDDQTMCWVAQVLAAEAASCSQSFDGPRRSIGVIEDKRDSS